MKNVDELKELLDNIEIQIQKCKVILEGGSIAQTTGGCETRERIDYSKKAAKVSKCLDQESSRVIEGVFDGQRMIGPDGKQYSIPANYISKSKLVEGDILKLTIDEEGNFVYKQIGPVERERLIGNLIKDGHTGEFNVLAEGKVFKVILASVTYYKGDEGDEVVVLAPKGVESQWAAIENVIKK